MRRVLLLLALFAGVPAPAAAQLPPAFANWPQSAPIAAGATDAPRLTAVPVTSADETAARDWRDLRLIDREGREVPFVLRARLGGTSAEWRPARVLNPAVVPGQYTEALLDTGRSGRVHNAVRLDIISPTDFLTWVEIAISDDARVWRVARARAPIYSLPREGLGSTTDVTYPDSTARFLRLRLLDGRGYTVQHASVALQAVTVAEFVPAGLPLRQLAGEVRRTTWRSADNGPRIPIGQVCFETSQAEFNRAVSIEHSENGDDWMRQANGEIHRMVEAGVPRTSLCTTFGEARAGSWRVTVYNRDDPPIADLTPTLYTTPRRVVFRQEPGEQYRLLFGNARATAAQYEVSRLVDAKALDAATSATLGASEPNTGYVDPAPWTERHPSVMWAALLAAVAALGALAIRALRTARPSTDAAGDTAAR